MIRAEVNLEGFDVARYSNRVSTILWKYSDYLGDAFKANIQASRYEWPRPTRRYGRLLGTTNLAKRKRIRAEQNGLAYTTVTSPRNIVDSGNFLRSQVRRRESPTDIRFTWGGTYGVNYAGYILDGVPKRDYPARDWITPALALRPPEAFFAAEWSRLGSLS